MLLYAILPKLPPMTKFHEAMRLAESVDTCPIRNENPSSAGPLTAAAPSNELHPSKVGFSSKPPEGLNTYVVEGGRGDLTIKLAVK
jgi:hypothetical protein